MCPSPMRQLRRNRITLLPSTVWTMRWVQYCPLLQQNLPKEPLEGAQALVSTRARAARPLRTWNEQVGQGT